MNVLQYTLQTKGEFSHKISKRIKDKVKGTMLSRLKVASISWSWKRRIRNRIGLLFSVRHHIKLSNDDLLSQVSQHSEFKVYDYIRLNRFSSVKGSYKQEIFIVNEPTWPNNKENGLPLLVMVCSPFAYSVIRIYLPPHASLVEEAIDSSSELIIELIRKGDD